MGLPHEKGGCGRNFRNIAGAKSGVHGAGNINVLKEDAVKHGRCRLVGRATVAAVVHGNQDSLLGRTQHGDVLEMDVLDVAPSSTLRLQVDQWAFRIRIVPRPHDNVFERHVTNAAALLGAD